MFGSYDWLQWCTREDSRGNAPHDLVHPSVTQNENVYPRWVTPSHVRINRTNPSHAMKGSKCILSRSFTWMDEVEYKYERGCTMGHHAASSTNHQGNLRVRSADEERESVCPMLTVANDSHHVLDTDTLDPLMREEHTKERLLKTVSKVSSDTGDSDSTRDTAGTLNRSPTGFDAYSVPPTHIRYLDEQGEVTEESDEGCCWSSDQEEEKEEEQEQESMRNQVGRIHPCIISRCNERHLLMNMGNPSMGRSDSHPGNRDENSSTGLHWGGMEGGQNSRQSSLTGGSVFNGSSSSCCNAHGLLKREMSEDAGDSLSVTLVSRGKVLSVHPAYVHSYSNATLVEDRHLKFPQYFSKEWQDRIHSFVTSVDSDTWVPQKNKMNFSLYSRNTPDEGTSTKGATRINASVIEILDVLRDPDTFHDVQSVLNKQFLRDESIGYLDLEYIDDYLGGRKRIGGVFHYRSRMPRPLSPRDFVWGEALGVFPNGDGVVVYKNGSCGSYVSFDSSRWSALITTKEKEKEKKEKKKEKGGMLAEGKKKRVCAFSRTLRLFKSKSKSKIVSPFFGSIGLCGYMLRRVNEFVTDVEYVTELRSMGKWPQWVLKKAQERQVRSVVKLKQLIEQQKLDEGDEVTSNEDDLSSSCPSSALQQNHTSACTSNVYERPEPVKRYVRSNTKYASDDR